MTTRRKLWTASFAVLLVASIVWPTTAPWWVLSLLYLVLLVDEIGGAITDRLLDTLREGIALRDSTIAADDKVIAAQSGLLDTRASIITAQRIVIDEHKRQSRRPG